MISFRPFSIAYKVESDGALVVFMCGRRADGKRGVFRILDTEPYFFVPEGEADRVDSEYIVRVERNEYLTLYGERVVKVVARYPFHVPDLRRKYSRTFEADIVYEQRIRIDLGIKGTVFVPDRPELRSADVQPDLSGAKIKPRVMVLDIETANRGRMAKPENPHGIVVSIAIWDSQSDQYIVMLNGRMTDQQKDESAAMFLKEGWAVRVVELEDERGLFQAFTEFLERYPPDIMCGWNSERYDFPYLKERAKMMEYASPDWRMYAYFDLMNAYERLYEGELESKALDFVAQKEGIGKKLEHKDTYEMWERDRGMLIRYNCNDVFLTKGIMLKRGLDEFFLSLASFSGCGIEDVLLTGRLVDSYMFHKLKGISVQPTKVQRQWDKIRGAAVLQPVKGVFRNVVEIDNTGEYANIIRTFNLSPETKRPGCDCNGEKCCVMPMDDPNDPDKWLPGGNHYTMEPRGIFPQTIDELVAMRANYKKTGEKEKERVVKEFALTLYGVLASDSYRNGDPEIAADITRVARAHLFWNRDMAQKSGGFVLYGDTDSCLFTLPQNGSGLAELKAKAEEIANEINQTLPGFSEQWGAERNFLAVKVEHVYDSFLQAGTKKRYACIYRDENGSFERDGVKYSMKIRGLEVRRSDAPPLTREVQEFVLKEVLLGWDGQKVKKFLSEVIKSLKSGKYPLTDLRIPKQWGQEHYKTVPIHVRAAKWSNEYLGKTFEPGDKPCYYFGYIEGKPRTDVFALEWDDPLPPGTVINWDKTIERALISPFEDILDVVGIIPSEILQPTVSLDAF